MQWGSEIEFLIRRSISKGELTQALKSKPELKSELIIFWEAFATLSASRLYTLRFGKKDTQYIGPDPIQFSELSAYANAIGITDVEHRMKLVRIVRKLDAVYLEAATGKVK